MCDHGHELREDLGRWIVAVGFHCGIFLEQCTTSGYIIILRRDAYIEIVVFNMHIESEMRRCIQ